MTPVDLLLALALIAALVALVFGVALLTDRARKSRPPELHRDGRSEA